MTPSLFRYAFGITTFLFLLLAPSAVTHAGNVISVNRGEPMESLEWNVTRGPCLADTNYPAGDGIREEWWNSNRNNQGSTNFGGAIVNAPGNLDGYVFSCAIAVPPRSDEARLVVCNNVNNQSDGASGCIPKSAPATAPIISNPTHNVVNPTTATLGGTVILDGGSPLLDRGTCWGTSAGAVNNCLSAGGGNLIGAFVDTGTSLPAGITVYYTAYARNAEGTSYTTPVASFSLPPAIPGGLTGAQGACESGIINLSWTGNGAARYELKNVFANTILQNSAATTFPHTGLAVGSAQRYTVQAFSAANVGSGESTVYDITAPGTCPYPNLSASIPTLSAAAVQQGQSITITAVISNTSLTEVAGNYVARFYVENSGDQTADFPAVDRTIAVNTPAGGSQTVTFSWPVPANAATNNIYRIGYHADINNSVNEGVGDSAIANWSGWSNNFSVIIPPPATPTNFVANSAPVLPAACGGRVNLAWTQSPTATDYEISINGGGWQILGDVDRYTISGRPVLTNINIRLRATNASGNSSPASLDVITSDRCDALDGTGCTINDGSNSCTGRVSWDLTGTVSPTIYNRTTGIEIGNTVTGTDVNLTLRHTAINNGTNTIEKRTLNVLFGSVLAIRAKCNNTSFFHPGYDACRPRPDIDVSVIPSTALIRTGNMAEIRTKIKVNYPLSCTFSGNAQVPPLVTNGAITYAGSGAEETFSKNTKVLTSAQIIQINCRIPGFSAAIDPLFTDSVRIDVVTGYVEP